MWYVDSGKIILKIFGMNINSPLSVDGMKSLKNAFAENLSHPASHGYKMNQVFLHLGRVKTSKVTKL